MKGRTITVKVRFPDRNTISRSQTLGTPTDSVRAIAAVAGALLDAVDVSIGVRLLGVAVSALGRGGGASRQLSFDSGPDESGESGSAEDERSFDGSEPEQERSHGWEEVEAAVSQIRIRYGHSAVSSAALVGPDGIVVKRRGDTQWGPSGSPDSGR